MPYVLTTQKAEAAEIHQAVEWNPQTAEAFAREMARVYGVNETQFVETMRCESIGFVDPAIQSGYTYHGQQEPSFGYAQFFIPSVLTTEDGIVMTKEMAIDPSIALRAAAYNFKIGNQGQWSCWRKKYGT